MTAVADAAAVLVAIAGLVVAAVAVGTRRVPLAIAVLFDFFTAAVLLWLAGTTTWPAIGAAALIVVVREFASRALTAARGARHR